MIVILCLVLVFVEVVFLWSSASPIEWFYWNLLIVALATLLALSIAAIVSA